MNRKSIIKNRLLILFAWLCSGFCAGLFAQEAVITAWPDSIDELSVFDPHHMGGGVDIGYFSLPKEAFPGSAVSVTGRELDKMPTNILSETFSGRLTGLHTQQNISELTFFGYTNVSMLIRGRNSYNGNIPTVIIDGIICPNQYWEFLSPKEIENVTVLKDGATSAIYGIQGAGGVIVITTKRGVTGKNQVEAYADYSLQQMTKRPLFVNSLQYAELRNQAGVNDGLGTFSQFSKDEIEGFRSGDPLYYPNNNWYDMFVKKAVMRQRVGVNLSGGNDKVRYFSNIGYVHQGEPVIVADEPDRKYTPNPDVQVANFRSNVDVNLNSYLSGFLRLTGNVKREMFAGGNENSTHYSRIFPLPPTMYGPLTPVVEDNPDAGNQVVANTASYEPAYGSINRSGFTQVIETNVIAQAGLNLDMGFLTKGLSASGSVAYQTYGRNYTASTQSYERWVRSSNMDEREFSRAGSAENSPLAYSKGSVFFYHLNLLGQFNYSRRFNGRHSVHAMSYIFYQQQEKEIISGSGVLPYKRQSMGVSATYGYLDRYFLKGDLGYSGSEQFHPDHRYIANPAVSASWLVSKEGFLSGIPALSLLKLRAAYGVAASDQLGGDRFLYLDFYDASGNEGLKGNPDLSAELVKMQNYGIDIRLLQFITLSLDYFHHRTNNMLVGVGSTIPTFQGISLGYYPKLNNGKMENKGFEIELGFDKRLTRDWSVFALAGFSQAINRVIKVNEMPYAEDYPYRYRTEGHTFGQPWGLLIDRNNGNGMFNSAEELAANRLTYVNGTPRVGDFIYYDLNGDRIIDEKDMIPVGYPNFPQQFFNLSAGVNFKNFEVSLLFQGVNRTSFFLGGLGAYEFSYQGVFNDIHMNAWTPERYAAGEKIDFPALSLSQSTSHANNDFFLQNGAYLRLKNAEVAYSLPAGVSQKIGAEKIRIAITGLNLLTFDKLSTKYIDPEIRNMNGFQPYRVFNLGVNITF